MCDAVFRVQSYSILHGFISSSGFRSPLLLVFLLRASLRQHPDPQPGGVTAAHEGDGHPRRGAESPGPTGHQRGCPGSRESHICSVDGR